MKQILIGITAILLSVFGTFAEDITTRSELSQPEFSEWLNGAGGETKKIKEPYAKFKKNRIKADDTLKEFLNEPLPEALVESVAILSFCGHNDIRGVGLPENLFLKLDEIAVSDSQSDSVRSATKCALAASDLLKVKEPNSKEGAALMLRVHQNLVSSIQLSSLPGLQRPVWKLFKDSTRLMNRGRIEVPLDFPVVMNVESERPISHYDFWIFIGKERIGEMTTNLSSKSGPIQATIHVIGKRILVSLPSPGDYTLKVSDRERRSKIFVPVKTGQLKAQVLNLNDNTEPGKPKDFYSGEWTTSVTKTLTRAQVQRNISSYRLDKRLADGSISKIVDIRADAVIIDYVKYSGKIDQVSTSKALFESIDGKISMEMTLLRKNELLVTFDQGGLGLVLNRVVKPEYNSTLSPVVKPK